MKKYEKCPICNGNGKIPKKVALRRKCADCGDHNHGCFGSGRKSGYGYNHCFDYVDSEGKPWKP